MQYEDNTPSQVATCGDECTGWPTKQAAISSLVPGSSTAPSHDPSSQLTRDICLDKKLQEDLVSRQTDCSKLQVLYRQFLSKGTGKFLIVFRYDDLS